MKDLKKRLSSRKLWLAVIAGLVVFLNHAFDLKLDLEEVLTIAGSLLTYVAFEGTKDIVHEIKK